MGLHSVSPRVVLLIPELHLLHCLLCDASLVVRVQLSSRNMANLVPFGKAMGLARLESTRPVVKGAGHLLNQKTITR
jgi:hypothetical protein